MTDYEIKAEIEERVNGLEERHRAEDRERLREDYRTVMSTEAGRRLVSAVCGKGDVFGFVYYKGKGDALALAYNTGRRELAASIYSMANEAAPEMVLKMFNERNELERKREKEKRRLAEELEKQIQTENQS